MPPRRWRAANPKFRARRLGYLAVTGRLIEHLARSQLAINQRVGSRYQREGIAIGDRNFSAAAGNAAFSEAGQAPGQILRRHAEARGQRALVMRKLDVRIPVMADRHSI